MPKKDDDEFLSDIGFQFTIEGSHAMLTGVVDPAFKLPTERQRILSELLGRPWEDFIE